MRSSPENKKPERRKRVAVEPGKSVSVEDLNGGSEQDEPDNPETEVTECEVTNSGDYDSENSFNESDKSRNEEELTNSTLSPLIYTDTSVGEWVKVLYEGVFIGKILQKTTGETMVQCLEKPFGQSRTLSRRSFGGRNKRLWDNPHRKPEILAFSNCACL